MHEIFVQKTQTHEKIIFAWEVYDESSSLYFNNKKKKVHYLS